MIQHDACGFHGSSGGPLLDLQGRVLGVNSYPGLQGYDVPGLTLAILQSLGGVGYISTFCVNLKYSLKYCRHLDATQFCFGYNTYCVGKWHNTPDTDVGPEGPFDRL